MTSWDRNLPRYKMEKKITFVRPSRKATHWGRNRCPNIYEAADFGLRTHWPTRKSVIKRLGPKMVCLLNPLLAFRENCTRKCTLDSSGCDIPTTAWSCRISHSKAFQQELFPHLWNCHFNDLIDFFLLMANEGMATGKSSQRTARWSYRDQPVITRPWL